MGKMKANRKFVDGEEAVSAVIGVILMVAITVAIAATVYVYVSGMMGTSPESTPSVQFVKDDSNNKLTVASADPTNLDWGDLEITPSAGFTWANLSATGFNFNATADSHFFLFYFLHFIRLILAICHYFNMIFFITAKSYQKL